LKPGSREQTKSVKSSSQANHQMSTKLFVGNLSFNTTENDLQEAFAPHGQVVEANLMMDRMTGRSRGFAFITYSTPEEAQKAIAAMNGAQLDGRALTVNIARPKEERPPGGGGGRDRGPRRDYGGGGGAPGGGYGGGSGGGGGGGRRERY
jgi:RNA recognition motif-containing protein